MTILFWIQPDVERMVYLVQKVSNSIFVIFLKAVKLHLKRERINIEFSSKEAIAYIENKRFM